MTKPKGKIFLIGGAEDKEDGRELLMREDNPEFKPFEILRDLIPDGKQKKEIEIITTASKEPEEMGDSYQEAFGIIGFNKVNCMNIANRDDAKNEEFIERILKASAVFFTGGDQFRLSTIIGSTPVFKAIYDRFYTDPKFTIAGTSAGAMALPKVMISAGQPTEAMLMGDIETSSGLGFFDSCIIDTHFIKRGRFGRLAYSVVANPSCIGFGLGEDTALILTGGTKMECLGSGMVIIIDSAEIRSTNISIAQLKEPIFVEDLKIHVMVKGNTYNTIDRKFSSGKRDQV